MLDVLHVIEWIRELFAWWEVAWMFVVCRMPMTLLWRVCAENIFDSIFGYHPQNTHMHKWQKVEFAQWTCTRSKNCVCYMWWNWKTVTFSLHLTREMSFWGRKAMLSIEATAATARRWKESAIAIGFIHLNEIWKKKSHFFCSFHFYWIRASNVYQIDFKHRE